MSRVQSMLKQTLVRILTEVLLGFSEYFFVCGCCSLVFLANHLNQKHIKTGLLTAVTCVQSSEHVQANASENFDSCFVRFQ